MCKNELFGKDFLVDIVEWLSDTYDGEFELGYPSKKEYENFGEEFLWKVLDWVCNNYKVDDVFLEEQLSEWALEHGYEFNWKGII